MKQTENRTDYAGLNGTHSIRVPDWGPFSKRLMGISHVANPAYGYRLDFCAYPQRQRGRAFVPYIGSGYHPWEANADLTYYVHRHDIEWKDQVYCDMAYYQIAPDSWVCRAEFVNKSGRAQNFELHNQASMIYTTGLSPSSLELIPARPRLAVGDRWFGAEHPEEFVSGSVTAAESLQYNGAMKGEHLESGFVDAVGLRFNRAAGDRVSYTINVPETAELPHLLIRYRLEAGKRASLRFGGLYGGTAVLSGGEGFLLHDLRLWKKTPGDYQFSIEGLGGDALILDGFLLCEENHTGATSFEPGKNERRPRIVGSTAHAAALKYDNCPYYYGVAADNRYRTAFVNRYDPASDEFVLDLINSTVRLPEKGSVVVYTSLCACNSAEAVQAWLAEPAPEPSALERAYRRIRKTAVRFEGNGAGRRYERSQNRMAAMTMTNIVYPVRCMGQFVKHFTPGRGWDCLYTWDSGFIGLGLDEFSLERAVENLNAYLTDEGDRERAFIHHGTPLPVQAYLYQDIYNKSGDAAFLAHYYGRVKGFHTFLSGRSVGSTTAEFRSGLLKTWDYFYNSGGWDDYPAQVFSRKNGLYPRVAPMVTNVHFINLCKILAIAAQRSGRAEDVSTYEGDIARVARAIDRYAWDEAAQTYSYVLHDEAGEAAGVLRDGAGVNHDMGLDGLYPVLAGLCDREREETLLRKLFDSKRFWSPVGLSTVDMTAPYYDPDGYWNGSVWMPHQWFFFKCLFDLGRPELSYQIAKRGLEVWKRENDATYDCFEVFDIASGRGQGCQHFSGLSTPVMKWYAALYRPGTVTAGIETLVDALDYDETSGALTAELTAYGGRMGLLCSVGEAAAYRVSVNGEPVDGAVLEPGTVALSLETGASLRAPRPYRIEIVPR